MQAVYLAIQAVIQNLQTATYNNHPKYQAKGESGTGGWLWLLATDRLSGTTMNRVCLSDPQSTDSTRDTLDWVPFGCSFLGADSDGKLAGKTCWFLATRNVTHVRQFCLFTNPLSPQSTYPTRIVRKNQPLQSFYRLRTLLGSRLSLIINSQFSRLRTLL